MEKLRYLDFLDPIHIIWRKGTADDPYVDKLDIVPVINQRIVLSEIPDKTSRVKIPSMKEVNYERYSEHFLNEDEFYVDYSNGIVHFHFAQESKTLSVSYKGRGLLLYPSSRIYHHDKNTDVVYSLKDITQQALDRLAALGIVQDDLANLEEELRKAIEDNHVNADQLRDIIERGLNAVNLVNNAYQTTKLIYKPYVETYDDLLREYPFPEVGWTVQVRDTGERFRWDGNDWIPIDILGGNIPLANENIDGLMSKEDYVKLKNISDYVNTRGLVFVIPQQVLTGIQDPHISFPFNGMIDSIQASVSKVGSADTAIRVEKSSDYVNWINITPTPLLIKAGEHFDDGYYSISDRVVQAGDVFRLYIPYSSDIANLNLTILIKTIEGEIQ